MSITAEILKKQSEIVDNIQSINKNFKKDGPGRRTTREYHDKRLNILEQQWKTFETNHASLVTMEAEKTGSYYEGRVYEKLQVLYNETRDLLLASRRSLEQQQQLKIALESEGRSSSDKQPEPEAYEESYSFGEFGRETNDQRTKDMLNEQRSNIKALARAIQKLEIESISEKWQLEDKMKTITQRWENYDRMYWKLDNIITDMSSYEQEYNSLEHLYENTKTIINKKIWAHHHQEKSAPKIELPMFNGTYSQWTTFKDLFMETVHLNSFISSAQKMQHLKSKLKGEAERLVQHLSISASNYETCWAILQQRYDNTRLLFSYHANELLNQPTIQQASAFLIKRMHDTTLENLNAITNLNIETSNWDPLLIHILLQKLDSETSQDFIESLQNPRDIPKLSQLLGFLENKFAAMEANIKQGRNNYDKQQNINKNNPSTSKNQTERKYSYNNYKEQDTKNIAKYAHYTAINCPNCKNQHGLYNCHEFINMNPNDRLRTATQLNVCKNCLFSHNGKTCNSEKNCKLCSKPHNTLLHDAYNSENGRAHRGQRVNTHVLKNEHCEVLLATAKIEVKSSSGSYLTLRALIDQGSQVSLLTEDAAQRLRLKRSKMDAIISGVGESPNNKCKGVLQLSCKAINNSFTFTTQALIINSLTNKLPNKTINKESIQHLEQIQLADPEFHISGDIDILLGAEVYSEIMMEGLIRTNNSNILAQQTRLGWIVCGKLKYFQCHVTINNIEEIAQFWEQEDIQQINQPTENNNICEEFYNKTTTRLTDGRYQVRLPLKPEIKKELGTSKKQAVAQFKQLEQKMAKNTEFAKQYKEFMQEYKELGHMTKSENKTNKLEYFMPHHGVIRSDAITTKLRVVFNASQKTSSKKSLNDLMEGGPNLQADLQSILLQWRQYRYVFTADIEKMYRFIGMHPEDQQLQKIVWRDSPQHPLEDYQLNTVTYGTRAAPWLALRTLQQLGQDEGDRYPEAKQILQQNFFVDDAIFGNHTITAARETRDQLNKLLKAGGFNLRKWASNAPCLVEDLPENIRNPKNFSFTETQTSKTLGLSWNPTNDEFIFTPTLTSKQTLKIPTKRQVLSEISTLFDPLGWLAPITVKSKILFQQLWKINLGWDDTLPENLQKEWCTLRTELTNMHKFTIKRWLGFEETKTTGELYAFCDASEKAYACVIYHAVRNKDGQLEMNIVAAKTKVAPIQKQITLPRLELSSAHLLSKLVSKIKQSMKQTFKITAWTDSMVVMGWINGDINRWNVYVANRVRSITETVPAENWHHIKSENNPADCASRGLLPSQLKDFSLWWKGPQNIKEDANLPNLNIKEILTNEETKKYYTATITSHEPNILSALLHKHSSISKAVRTLCWISRFITSTRATGDSKLCGKALTLQELRTARTMIIKQIQLEHFKEDIKDLKTKGMVSRKSTLIKLNPFIDEKGILRIGGRLNNSYLSENAKHPIIIPANNRLTNLLIDEAHAVTLHGGARLTLTTLRQQYWVIGGNSTVKKHLKHCVKCCRYKNQKQYQLMGDLPMVRTTPSPPFYNTGVDFTGFVDIKLNKGRGVKTSKGYVVVFVCMATKAVHLELATDLSTPTFLQALKRMVARRGCPKHIYSDNGTNFVGADREIHKHLKQEQTVNNETSHREFNKLGLQWHFNAPSWPSAGGIWESAVSKMKFHLKRCLGEQKLTYEEFLTLLTQIEACLNSRPLCPITEDIEDLECLTPAHFLIGRPVVSIPEENYGDSKISLHRRWKLVEQIHQQFWRRWSSEYLQELQVRSKWLRKQKNITLDDIVLIKEDNLPPTRWALGRVLEVHPGRDGLVRVATVKTKDSVYKRPITKLVRLPIEHSDSNASPPEPNSTNTKNTECDSTKAQQKQTANKQNRKVKGSNLLSLLLVMLTLFQPSSQAEDLANITPFEENKILYFDNMGKLQNIHDTWKIVTYYNMSEYWNGLNNVQRLITHVESRCEGFAYRTMCDSIIAELKQEMEDLNHNNNLLKTQHGTASRRLARGLVNGVGYLANTLFGVLDDSFAEKYKTDIEAVNNNEKHLLALIKNQTSIVEAHNNILKRNEEVMMKQFRLIQKHLNKTDEFVNEMNNRISEEDNIIYFNTMSMAANMFISKLQSMQEILLETATNIHHGQVDTRLFNQDQLERELNIISGQLPAHLFLPIDNIRNQLTNIYKLLTVKSRVIDKYFIIEMSMPLTNEVKYNLYRTIPIPIKQKNTTISLRTTSEYLAVNLRKDTYILLSDKEISACSKIESNNYICTINVPTYNMHSEESPCEVSILTNSSTTKCVYERQQCSDKWTPLSTPNAWIYFCCDECLPRIICDDHMTTKSLRLAGLIQTEQGCMIKYGGTTIYTQRYFQNKLSVDPHISVPYTDLGDLNSIPTNQNNLPSIVQLTTDDNTRTLQELQNKINVLKQQNVLPDTISTHDVHQYAISYATMGLVIVILVGAGCKYMHWKKQRRLDMNEHKAEQAERTRPQMIEMRTLPRRSTRPNPPIYAKPHAINFNI